MRDLFSDHPDPEWNGRADQFVLTRLEVFNWGTFAGIHGIPIAPEGHLFTGKSGSGKSTLLDAHAALLTPPKWKDYNTAAAQEGERKSGDRTDLSYVRGAWAQQTDEEGGLASQFLRSETTWSAVAEVYQNGRGNAVTLGMLLWVRGRTTAPGDVQRRYFVLTRDFHLKELQFFPDSDFDLRQFKSKLPDLTVYSEFSAYGERFRGLLSIEEELALKLLHKTQSAKNLGDLNLFLRDFMLDPPETFRIKDQLVQEFQALKEAHEAVVRAREQIAVLDQARLARDAEVKARADLHLFLQADEAIPEFFNDRRRQLFHRQKGSAQEKKAMLEAKRRQIAVDQTHAQEEVAALKELRDGAGGRQLAEWEREIQDLATRRDRATARRPKLEENCRLAGVQAPTSAEALAALRSRAEQGREAGQTAQAQAKSAVDEKKEQLWRAGNLMREASKLAEEWSRRKTRIDPDLQRIRDDLVRHLRGTEEELPFLGELLEVRGDEQAWRGSIERVMAGAAPTMLVPQRHYAAVRDYVDTTNLRNRLRYETEPHWTRAGSEPGALSLMRKLDVKPGDFKDWVEALLRERFDFACVETPAEFAQHARAVTRRGQVKQGPNRHEKNDSHALDDPRYWSLGFDNSDKVRLFRAEAQKRAAEYSDLQQALSHLEETLSTLARQGLAWERLLEWEWDEVDVAGPTARIVQIEELTRQFREQNRELSDLDKRLESAKRKASEVAEDLRQVDLEVGSVDRELSDLELKLLELGAPSPTPIPEEILQVIQPADDPPVRDPVSESEIQRAEQSTRRATQQRRDEAKDRQSQALRQMEDRFREFLTRWSEFSGDLRPDPDHSEEFMSLWERLVQDGLPKFEKNFLDLLTEQSDNNLTSLNTRLDQERRTIRSRLSTVNEGLKDARFNQELGSFLVVHVEDRRLREVTEFRQRIGQALGYSLGRDLEHAEDRFALINGLVADLSSSDPEKVRWQKQVLDVRQHVEFVAKELSEEGAELNVYPSGAGKSGGQRQLLSASVLAAALRYQLGGREKNLPRFTTVVLDEAFDKADTDFTRSALTTFRRLGFQLILATPGKSLETIQTFVGGGSLISIQDQKFSGISSIFYESAERLPS